MIRYYLSIIILFTISEMYSQPLENLVGQIHKKSDTSIAANPSTICEYLAYEGFDYSVDTPLEGLNKGEGFIQSWNVQNGNTGIPGYQIASSTGSLDYPDLTVSGNRCSGGKDYLTSGRLFNTSASGPFADYVTNSEAFIGANHTGQSLWMSLLLSKTTNNDDEVVVELHKDNIPWCGPCQGDLRLGFGYFGSNSNVGGQRKWSLYYDGTVYPTNINVEIGTTVIMVIKLTFNNEGTDVELYINPPNIGGTQPGSSPDIEISTESPFVFKSFAFYGGNIPGRGNLDEIRLATTYQCTVPDASIEYHLPPEAIIVANPTSGTSPLTVTFDGSQSVNNSSGSLTYEWNFGDGSANSSDDITQHTYNIGGGIATATLTVTDTNGKFNTANTSITLLDQNGSFSCLTSITSVKKADCSGNNAHLRVGNAYDRVMTLTLENDTINPIYGGEYTGLAAGIYQLTVEGSNGCYEHFDLHVEIDSNSCTGWSPNLCAMEIGTNLTGFADWEPHRAMRNFLKNTRGDAIPYSIECDCWSFDEAINQSIFNQMSFDSGGYPDHLPQATSEGDILLRYFVSASGANMPPGKTYVLLYDGNGNIDISGSFANVDKQPNRIQFDLQGDGTFWFQLTQSTMGDHVRNIRIVRLEDEDADLINEPFYSEFLNKIEPFSVLRYMDWQSTNNNPMVSWNERTLPERFSYGTAQGVPYELIIQLANQTKKDIWICVPHAADNDFITQMAQMFKNQLDPSINIYIEYSNEVWNWIFGQAQYNIEHNPFDLNYGRAMALKAKNVFDIWHQVFADEKCRVKRVLGIQGGFNWLNEQILSHLNQNDWDYGSPTHYFGLDHGETGNPRLDLLGSSATVDDIMTNAQNNFDIFKETVKQDYRNVQILGKEVITYEGGQHFVGNVFGIPYDYQQSMWDAQNSMQMYDMYKMMHDSIRHWGCRLATNFSLAGAQESIYGSWGVMETIDIQEPYITTAPKYQALLDCMPDVQCLNTNIWLGEHSSLWSERCNWSKGKIPDENTQVIINLIYQYAPEVDITTTIGSLMIESGTNLTILNGIKLTVLDQ